MKSIVQEMLTKKPYWINRNRDTYGLFFLPYSKISEHPPVTLSINMPNGSYYAFVLLECFPGDFFDPQKINFQFRFNQHNKFIIPRNNRLIRGAFRLYHCYLDLGEAQVKDNKFSIEVKFNPKDVPYVIRHIKFVPKSGLKNKKPDEFNEGEFRKRTEALRSLGYL